MTVDRLHVFIFPFGVYTVDFTAVVAKNGLFIFFHCARRFGDPFGNDMDGNDTSSSAFGGLLCGSFEWVQ